MTEIQKILFKYQDEKYGNFLAKLVPTEKREAFIGVRSPAYKKIVTEVNELPEEIKKEFYNSLPHKYHEENALHVALINGIKNFDECTVELEKFLPFITNWAVSDGLKPKVFEKNKDKIIGKLKLWIQDEKPYTKRVGILLLMKFFLDDAFNAEYLNWPAEIRSEEYYVNMMIAWFFAEALVKQWDSTIPFIQNQKLEAWTHNKAIQKAIESFRITSEQKDYLRSLKVKVSKKARTN